MPASPLLPDHQARQALLSHYGDPDAGAPIVQTFDHLELEYAALRKRCALFDAAHRATLEISGDDRLTFLDAMLTQRVRDMAPGDVRDSFWLSRKGRIIADLRLIQLEDRTIVDLDRLVAAQAAQTLEQFLFTEDVTITDRTPQLSRLWLIGPAAPRLLTEAGAAELAHLEPFRAAEGVIDNAPVVISRSALGDLPFFELTAESARLPSLYRHLLQLGELPSHDPADSPPDTPAARIRLRPTGWHAINVARIESGLPMFNIDFGQTNLPAETGLLDARVDFKKGCYLGQEVVARMHALGHPKQTLAALRIDAVSDELQAQTGAELFLPDNPDKPVGAVTSSTIAPMLASAHIAFAMLRWGAHEPGVTLTLRAPGLETRATVQPSLTFWPPASPS